MAYRNGTYVAFDGMGEPNPARSDFKYYTVMKGWNALSDIDFKYIDSHHKTSSVRDSSKRETLMRAINKRLSGSKNVVVILSNETRKEGSELSYEIKRAVDFYQLPLIVTYTGYRVVADSSKLSHRWPHALQCRIEDGSAKAIHIPFLAWAISAAIDQFDFGNLPPNSLCCYSKDAYLKFGGIKNFVNTIA